MITRLIITGLITFFTTAIYCQEVELLIPSLPVKDGYIIKYKRPEHDNRIVDYVDGVSIKTKTDSCFSLQDGEVASVFDLGEELVITIRTVNDRFLSYSHLSKSFINKKDFVKRGDAIGLLKENEDKIKTKELQFLITDNKANFLSFQQCINYLWIHASTCSDYPPAL